MSWIDAYVEARIALPSNVRISTSTTPWGVTRIEARAYCGWEILTLSYSVAPDAEDRWLLTRLAEDAARYWQEMLTERYSLPTA